MVGTRDTVTASYMEESLLLLNGRAKIREVYFDIRTPEAPIDVWRWPRFITQPAPSHPGIHIVGDVTSQMVTLAGETIGSIERTSLRAAQERGLDILYPGDQVTVGKVTVQTFKDNPFLLEHDKEAAVVELSVQRANRTAFFMRPLLILRRGTMADGEHADTLNALGLRLQAFHDTDQEAVERLRRLHQLVTLDMANVQQTMATLGGEVHKPSWASLAGDLSVSVAQGRLDELINLAAFVGYSQGRLEAQMKMEPIARSGLNRAEQSRNAGRRGGEANINPSRRSFAIAFWKNDPTATKHAVAKAFCANHPGSDLKSVTRSVARVSPPTSPSYRSR